MGKLEIRKLQPEETLFGGEKGFLTPLKSSPVSPSDQNPTDAAVKNADRTQEGGEITQRGTQGLNEVPADDPIYQRGWMIGSVPSRNLTGNLDNAKETPFQSEKHPLTPTEREDRLRDLADAERAMSIEAYEAIEGHPYREEEHDQGKPER